MKGEHYAKFPPLPPHKKLTVALVLVMQIFYGSMTHISDLLNVCENWGALFCFFNYYSFKLVIYSLLLKVYYFSQSIWSKPGQFLYNMCTACWAV